MNRAADIAGAALPVLDEIGFCAWLSKADRGSALVYHQGALTLDRAPGMSTLPPEAVRRLDRLADRAFAAAERGLVHLVQRRIGECAFAYLAIARPRTRAFPAAIAALVESVADPAPIH